MFPANGILDMVRCPHVMCIQPESLATIWRVASGAGCAMSNAFGETLRLSKKHEDFTPESPGKRNCLPSEVGWTFESDTLRQERSVSPLMSQRFWSNVSASHTRPIVRRASKRSNSGLENHPGPGASMIRARKVRRQRACREICAERRSSPLQDSYPCTHS
jgi:hypothetical protein